MKVNFAISIDPGGPLLSREDCDRYSDLVKMAEDYGAVAIGTYDSAFIGGDAFVRATLIARCDSCSGRGAADQPTHARAASDGVFSRVDRQPYGWARIHGYRERRQRRAQYRLQNRLARADRGIR